MLRKYYFQFGITLLMILLETALALMFPLCIGKAIDSAINGSFLGALQLGGLGITTLIVGVWRRWSDSRFYAKVFQDMGSMTLSKMDNSTSSKKSASLSMIRELIEFLENTMPELIGNIIGLIGVIGIIATLNLKVFYGGLLVGLLVFVIYWLTRSKTIQFNKLSNDEFERQVAIISKNDGKALKIHLKQMMKWNIKLSDLEAINFSISWMFLMTFLVLAIASAVWDDIVGYGALFALLMYVFQYIENVINLPLFYQNWLRLKEIIHRLEHA
ncbi:MAG: ABC transporter six-transmembrane domain-containing protein [Bacteroidota bacterium]